MKCGYHDGGCAWRGSLGDYAAHSISCSVGGNAGNGSPSREELDSLRQEVARLKSQNQILERRPNLPTLFNGTYNFGRENVVQLSQLISRYLENKPEEIDKNRIYNCVRACYTDFNRGFGDNPEHYDIDMRMLLATCLASTWFSPNQYSSMLKWYNEHF